jgi:hypothetical protein
MTRFFVSLAFFLASGKQVAYVDLTVPPKTPETRTGPITVGGGGGPASYHHPDPQTLPVSVKLSRFVSLVENGVPKDSVEVVLTNTGKMEIVLPVGDDPALILAPYQTDRRYLAILVMAANIDVRADTNGGIVASARAAESAIGGETTVRVAPGDSVTYRVPINRWRADHDRTLTQGAELQISAEVMLMRVENQPDGSEFQGVVGDMLHSENKLTWPPN